MSDLAFKNWTTIGVSAGVVLALAACGGGGSSGDEGGGRFVSDNPLGPVGGDDGDAGYSGDGGETGAAGEDGGDDGADPGSGQGGDDEGGDGTRDITEADIIAVEGDRLYALSRYGGLAVIDISQPGVLPVLGRFRANAEPFEMYVEDGQVFVMYSSWGQYELEEETGIYAWHTTSRLMALDASDPSDIHATGDFSMPGALADSRRVGDILYVVTYEDGWCWGCTENLASTVVTSLDVSDETNVLQVDQLRFDDGQDAWWGGPRSVSATDERMYVAGRGDWETGRSTIDVIDISDPAGDLVQGAEIAVAGQIDSRWQMDEHEGVLRVVSQAGWGGQNAPRIETFSVASATDVAPLGALDMTLPRPETLQSVRFDGVRGYAITFEQTDPLFTLDLSDPAAPRQVGELEIPGWVYHMEPRGDRLLGIGFDSGNPEGSINASLFDVSDMDNPTLLERVSFGGDWASFAEDQNRIHKSFQILDELGLLLVPFSGWNYDDGDCWGSYQSGIQLVDWQGDTLALRGVAPSHGQARRALVHEGRLLGISDLAVETFDITDRDAPSKTAETTLAANVTGMEVVGDVLVRLSQDWWSGRTLLELADASDPESPQALGRLNLDEVVPAAAQDAELGCWSYGWYDTEMFVHDGFVYLVREDWDEVGGQHSSIDVVDITDPFAPTYATTIELPFGREWSYGPHLTNDEKRMLLVDDALVMLSTDVHWNESGDFSTSHAAFEIVSLAEPGHPVHAASIERPDALTHGGLQAFGDSVVSWHMRAANADASKVRFYLDRVDIEGTEAEPHDPVNVPGAVVAWDAAERRAVVVDFQLEAAPLEACQAHPAGQWWYGPGDEEGTCKIARRDLHLVSVDEGEATLLDTIALEGDDAVVRGAAASTSRLFVHLQRGSWSYTEDGGYTMPKAEVAVFTDWRGDALSTSAIAEVPGDSSWLSELQALDTRLVFRADNGLGELDAATPEAPQIEVHDLYGWWCYDLDADADTAYCAMGEYGVQAVALGQ